jgi:hypothetical protein
MAQFLEFACPNCQARLRSRDRSLVGREMPCPDCRQALRISDSDDGRLVATLVAAPLASKTVPAGSSRGPIRIAIGSVIVLCSGLLFYVTREPGAAPAPQPAQVNPPPVEPVVPNPPAPAEAEVALRLKQLGGWLDESRKVDGAWPLGLDGAESLPEAQRLSWMAHLAERNVHDGAPPPNRNQAWNAADNDRFVRRRIDAFQAPDAVAAGPDGFPAGHFVGVAGVGKDASSLPKAHPRAGIFGLNRRTTTEDVKDGLSNTLLVVGVESNLHSWANGAHSVRGFTEAPYVRGPDGFGTGQADGMHVLMADGSVRFLDTKADPVVTRRMAAMADGLPLDPKAPGDPRDLEPVMTPVTPIAGNLDKLPVPVNPADDLPITPELASDLPKIDIEKALAQPIKQYLLVKPTPAVDVLYEIRELCAVPLDWSSLPSDADAPLSKSISVALENTTVGAILSTVAEQLSAEISQTPFGVRLVPRKI